MYPLFIRCNKIFSFYKKLLFIFVIFTFILATTTPVVAIEPGEPDLIKSIYNPTSGTIPGHFYKPYAIAINKNGNIFYVADYNSNVVVAFDLMGNQYPGFGGGGQNKLGDENGHFSSITSLAVDNFGNIYALDSTRCRIQKFDPSGNFITKWGSSGTGDGQFSSPQTIAVDSYNNVYVVDKGNNRIQKFDVNGTFITKWGSSGSDDGKFSAPFSIAIDLSNRIYISDVNNSRIQKFDTNGNFLGKWGSVGVGNGQIVAPQSIAVDSTANIYVIDALSRLQKFDTDGNFISLLASSGTGDGKIDNTYNYNILAIDSSDNVYESELGTLRIQKFNTSGTYEYKISNPTPGDGQFYRPYSVAVDSSNNIYVIDSRIQKFDPSGNFITKWGSSGTGDGQFSGAVGIAVDSHGNVYTTEQGTDRVQKFSSSGQFVTKWGGLGDGDGKFNNPVMVAVDANDNVYVADSNNKRVQKFNSDGTFIAKWEFSSAADGVAFDTTGNMYISDYSCTISKFSSSGELVKTWGGCGVENGKFYEPTALGIDTSNNIYVMDYANNRIQVFDSDGNFRTKWGRAGSENKGFNGAVGIVVDHINRIIVADTNSNRVQIFGDQTSPNGGSVHYAGGDYDSTTVNLLVSDGTDSFSGIDTSTRIIQRRTATLYGDSCGEFGEYLTIFPSNAWPNYADSVLARGYCYQYRYLVSDKNTNQATYPSSNIAKIHYSVPGEQGCVNESPKGFPPRIIQALTNESGKSIIVRFISTQIPMDHFVLEYGTNPGSYQFASSDINGSGAMQYTVNYLSPGTKYYFRVRTGNGCAVGSWSEEYQVTTKSTTNNSASINTLITKMTGLFDQIRPTPTQQPFPSSSSPVNPHNHWFELVATMIVSFVRRMFNSF